MLSVETWFFVVAAGAVALFFTILWMRWRMRASKSRFAFAVLSTLFACLASYLSAVAFDLPSLLAVYTLNNLGVSPPIDTGGTITNILSLIATLFICWNIYRFGVRTIENWEAPLRVSEQKLAEERNDDSLIHLAINGAMTLAKMQQDPLASDFVVDWRKQQTPAPEAVEASVLLRDLFLARFGEASIPDEGWRDRGRLWVGEMYAVTGTTTFPIIVLILDERPTEDFLEARLEELDLETVDQETRLYALYPSELLDTAEGKVIALGERSVTVLGSRAMLMASLDLNYYARQILMTFHSDLIGGTQSTLARSYVELEVTPHRLGGTPEKLVDLLSVWEGETSRRHLAITGEYGQGKSSAMLKLCADWAEAFLRGKNRHKRVPLLIELRGRNPAEMDPRAFLATWCERYRLNAGQVFNLIRSGEAIIIFEGFDELKNAGREYDRHQHFSALWRFAFPGVKLIFTGRPNFFLDDVEANRTLRRSATQGADGSAYTEIYQLNLMSPEQIREACRDYPTEVRNGILSTIDNDPTFAEIVSRPSMLPVVATIWPKVEQLVRDQSGLTGAKLIELYIQAVYDRKEAELERDRVERAAPDGSRYLVLPKVARQLLTLRTAWVMAVKGYQNTIRRSEIAEIVHQSYASLLTHARSTEADRTLAEGMRRFEESHKEDTLADRIEVIATEICSAGLLVPDPASGAGSLRFAHKQFYEYLVASAAAQQMSPLNGIGMFLGAGNTSTLRTLRIIGRIPVSCRFLCQTHEDQIFEKINTFDRLALFILNKCNNYIINNVRVMGIAKLLLPNDALDIVTIIRSFALQIDILDIVRIVLLPIMILSFGYSLSNSIQTPVDQIYNVILFAWGPVSFIILIIALLPLLLLLFARFMLDVRTSIFANVIAWGQIISNKPWETRVMGSLILSSYMLSPERDYIKLQNGQELSI